MTDLILRSVFPEPPGDDVRLAFRKHVAGTGQPETFDLISTERPPTEGTVEVLLHPVDINRKTRSDKREAPCPICSAASPKWLHGGSLIWCENTQAIYAIGPDCYSGLWVDGRMNRAINLFKESEKAKADGIRLYHLILRIPRMLGWIAANAGLAHTVTELHASFARDVRQLRGILWRSLKATDGVAMDRGPLADIPIGAVWGRTFLSGSWPISSDMEAAAVVLRSYPVLSGSDLLTWIDNLTPSVRHQKCREIDVARARLAKAAERMTEAGRFLSTYNVELLGRWARSAGAPTAFSVSMTTSRVTFRHQDAFWQGTIRLPAPRGHPEKARDWTLDDDEAA